MVNDDFNKASLSTTDHRLSRRTAIKSLSLGLVTFPFIANGSMTTVSESALDPEERIISVEERSMADMQQFIEDCITANKESNPQAAVKEVLIRAVRDHQKMLKIIGPPTEAGLKVFHRSKDLTIFAAAWTPQMNLMPHNHRMWANIGIYTGREDNILWEQSDKGMGLEANIARCLFAGDVADLSSNAIHSVTNPLPRYTGGIHIYGGDFFDTVRSQWDPETLAEGPSDGEAIRAIFNRENERMKKMNDQ